jgi:hypothetical protein
VAELQNGRTVVRYCRHEHMSRDDLGLPKVSLGSIMSDSSAPCGRTPSEAAVSGVARPQGGGAATVFYPLGHPTPYRYGTVAINDESNFELK